MGKYSVYEQQHQHQSTQQYSILQTAYINGSPALRATSHITLWNRYSIQSINNDVYTDVLRTAINSSIFLFSPSRPPIEASFAGRGKCAISFGFVAVAFSFIRADELSMHIIRVREVSMEKQEFILHKWTHDILLCYPQDINTMILCISWCRLGGHWRSTVYQLSIIQSKCKWNKRITSGDNP